MKKFRRIAAYLAGPLVIILGWCISGLENSAVKGLVRDKGEIISSVIRDSVDRQGIREYAPDIVFTYKAGNATYTSKNITMSPVIFNTRVEAERVVARYRPGTTVQIYYDRKNPSTAYLETGFVGNGGLTVGLGAVITLILAPLTYLSERRNRGSWTPLGGST